jgi:hypothetical protein
MYTNVARTQGERFGMAERTSAEYKSFLDELRGKNVHKTDAQVQEMIDTRTPKDQIADLQTRLESVEEVLRSMLAVEQLSKAGQEQTEWGRRGEPDVIVR